MSVIRISNTKILKLTNVITQEIDIIENFDFATKVTQIENYIKSKGATPWDH